MPNRVIKDSIRSSPKVDSLTWFEEVVFYRLIVSADDYGCFDGRETVVKNTLFPAKENITKKAIEDAIGKLVSVGLLCRYTVSGMPYLCFPTWEKHQRIRNKHRKYPEPPAECHLTADGGPLPADGQPESNPERIQSESKSESESESESEQQSGHMHACGTRTRKCEPPGFEEVEAYCAQRGNKVDPRTFFDYFSASGWVDSTGKPVRSWKQKVIAWEGREWRHGAGSKHKAGMEQNRGSDGRWEIAYDVEG